MSEHVIWRAYSQNIGPLPPSYSPYADSHERRTGSSRRKSSGYAAIGGILIIVSAICGFIEGILIVWVGTLFGSSSGGLTDVSGVFSACGIILFIFSILALLGGVSALMRKSWGLALVGGIFALFTIGPYFAGSILGLVGLIFIAMSRNDFIADESSFQESSYSPAIPQCPTCGGPLYYNQASASWSCGRCQQGNAPAVVRPAREASEKPAASAPDGVCPRCGSRANKSSSGRWICPRCGLI